MIFDLVRDFADALAVMPAGHPRRRLLRLLEEAVRRDVHFVGRHPTALFQCLWNTCWWYDAPAAAYRYEAPVERWGEAIPGEGAGRRPLSTLLEGWRAVRAGVPWLRSLRPPDPHLGTAQQFVLQAHTAQCRHAAFSPDGAWLATAARDGVRVWDVATGAEVLRLAGHTGRVDAVCFSRDGRRLATGSNDVRVWDAVSGAELLRLMGDGGAAQMVHGVCFSPDGRRLAAGSTDGVVRVWDAAGGEPLWLGRHKWRARGVCFSPDGRRLASASWDRTACVWDAATGRLVHRLDRHTGDVNGVCFSPDGQSLATASYDGTARVWDAATGAARLRLEGHTGRVTSVAYSPDGGRLATASDDRTVRVWDAATGAPIRVLRGHAAVMCACFSPDGRLASVSGDFLVRGWDLDAGGEAFALAGHTDKIRQVSFSPDGRLLLSAAADGTARVWDADTGAEIACFRGEERQVAGMFLSPHDRWMAAMSADGVGQVWDMVNNTCLELHYRPDAKEWSFPPANPAADDWGLTDIGFDAELAYPPGGPPVAWFPAKTGGAYARHPTRPSFAWGANSHLWYATLEDPPAVADGQESAPGVPSSLMPAGRPGIA